MSPGSAFVSAAVAVGALAVGHGGVARARPERCPEWQGDLGLLASSPSATWPGQTLGAELSVHAAMGDWLVGGRASYSLASEDSDATHYDLGELRLRASAGLRARVGRGAWFVRGGLGLNAVRDARSSHRGMAGEDATRWGAEVAADVVAGIELGLGSTWVLVMDGGPTLASGGAGFGWTATAAFGWRP